MKSDRTKLNQSNLKKKTINQTTIKIKTKKKLMNQDSEGEDETDRVRAEVVSSLFSVTSPSSSFFTTGFDFSSKSSWSTWPISSLGSSLTLSRSFRWLVRFIWGPGVKSGDRNGLEKESGAVKGKAGTGKVKWEGERDGRADELGKALSNAAEEGGPSLPLSPLTLPDEPLLLMG